MKRKRKYRRRRSPIKWQAVCVVCAVIVVCCVTTLVVRYMRRKAAIAAIEALAREVNQPMPELEYEPPEEEPPVAIEIPYKNLDWDELNEINEDIYAWIYVPGCDVDYPVLQDPEDDGYYLNHNMDGSKGYPGCLYTEATYNAKDFSDNNTVIYGHNLKDQTMFSHLHNLEEANLYDEHFIYIYTKDASYVYRIYAVYDYTDAHLLANEDMTDPEIFAEYLESVKTAKSDGRVRNIAADIFPTSDDRIITLSTCTSDHDPERRFLTQGVLVYSTDEGIF